MNRLAVRRSRPSRETHLAQATRLLRGKAAIRPRQASVGVGVGTLPLSNPEPEAELTSLRRQRDALQRALSEAAQVQRIFSAPRQVRLREFEIAAESFPAQHVSGDVLVILDLGEHALLAIGDICGKGLFAGMWFTHLAGLIRMLAGSCPDPARMAEAINTHLSSLQPEPPMATLFLGRLHLPSGELTYCNAGHPAPLLLRAGGEVDRLAVGGPLLGALGGATFSDGYAQLAPGEALIGYSDGVIECRNGAGEDFDPTRLAAAARSSGGRSADAILFSILGATQDFAGTQARADDIALMVLRRKAGATNKAEG